MPAIAVVGAALSPGSEIGERGTVRRSVRAKPGVKSERECGSDVVGKERVARREDSLAWTDEVAFSKAASSWIKARMVGTSGKIKL
jgi:hypothetical protein